MSLLSVQSNERPAYCDNIRTRATHVHGMLQHPTQPVIMHTDDSILCCIEYHESPRPTAVRTDMYLFDAPTCEAVATAQEAAGLDVLHNRRW